MKEQDYTIIEQYFNNELSEKEKAEVTKKCANDKLFLAAFNRQKLLLEVVDEQYETELRTLLKTKEAKIIANNSTEKTTPIIKKINPKKWWTIAASFLVLVVSSWLLFQTINQDKPTNEAVFAQHFEPYRNFLVPIERNNPLANPLQQAFQQYENEQFIAAINGFDEILKDSLSADILFYKGVAELAEVKPKAAIESFEKSLELKTQFQEEAKWYLILANLKLGNKEAVEHQKEKFINDFPRSIYIEKIKAF